MRKSMMWAMALCVAALGAMCWGAEPETPKAPAAIMPAVEPKPLSVNVQEGLKWLVDHQLPNGSWGQGEESANMGGGAALKDAPNVADTCAAALALMRAGSTPSKGPHAEKILKAVEFVCGEIEQSDADSLYVTKLRGTRLQQKLGPYIDTFMATLLLAEMKGNMPSPAAEKRVAEALDRALTKIQKNQQKDGTWNNEGWAPVVSQGMAAKALNRAAQQGAQVDEKVRANAEDYAKKQYDEKTGKYAKEGAAGVELYSAAFNAGAVRDSVNTNQLKVADAEKRAREGKTEEERQSAREELDRYEKAQKNLEAQTGALTSKLEDKGFVSGFGSNGGEEFLSYMNIAEVLVVNGGEEWTKWDKSMTENLNRIQNQDGSWTGHHCVTGRTFCTSAALMVLMADRATVPVAAGIRR